MNKAMTVFGGAILATGLILAWYWFGWKLALVLTLVGWGHNMERHNEDN